MRRQFAVLLALGMILAGPTIIIARILQTRLHVDPGTWGGAGLTILSLALGMAGLFVGIVVLAHIAHAKPETLDSPYPLLTLANTNASVKTLVTRAPFFQAPILSLEDLQALRHLEKQLRHSSFVVVLSTDRFPAASEALLREFLLANSEASESMMLEVHPGRILLKLGPLVNLPKDVLATRSDKSNQESLKSASKEYNNVRSTTSVFAT